MADKPVAASPTREQIPERLHSRLAHHTMRRQAALGLRVMLIFLVVLLGLPLINRFAPELAAHNIFGFTASWLLLGVLFYPITWVLSYYFIKASNRIESECADWRKVLGEEAGEPLEPEGIDDVKPAFIKDDEEPRA